MVSSFFFLHLVFNFSWLLCASQHFYVCSILCQSCCGKDGVKVERQAQLALLFDPSSGPGWWGSEIDLMRIKAEKHCPTQTSGTCSCVWKLWMGWKQSLMGWKLLPKRKLRLFCDDLSSWQVFMTVQIFTDNRGGKVRMEWRSSHETFVRIKCILTPFLRMKCQLEGMILMQRK